jgi:recombination protein RecT
MKSLLEPKPTTPATQTAKRANPQAVAKTGIAEEFASPALVAEVQKVLPKHLTAERLLRVSQTMVLYKPELLACTRDSLRRCVLICAQAGLEPDGRLAHIIAFGNTAQVIFDWKGLVALASRNNVQVTAKLVFSGDAFEVLEDDGEGRTRVNHSADYTQARGEIVAVYSRAKMQDGSVDYEIMSADEVEGVRQSFSRAKDSMPWVKSWGEMAKKTVIKRHSKRWDLMPEIRDVLYADDDNLPVKEPKPMLRPIFASPQIENGPQIEPEPPEMPQDAKEGIRPAPTPSKPQGGAKAESPTPTITLPATPNSPKTESEVKKAAPIVIRELLKAAKLKEADLISFLASIQLIEPEATNLEEIDLANDTLLGQVAEEWQEFARRVSEFAANPAPE